MLFYVQGDTEYIQVRRRGRFSMERACAQSQVHRSAAVKSAMSKFLHNMQLFGLSYVDDGRVEIRGNLPHVDYSEDVTPDLGPLARPHPLDLAANAAFERAERMRMGRNPDINTTNTTSDLMDFRIIATFRKPISKRMIPKMNTGGRK